MALPLNQNTFTVNIIGEVTQEQWVGDFTCICVPTINQRNVISREFIREVGDHFVATDELKIRAEWLSHIRVRILKGPTWWEEMGFGRNMLDDNVLLELYNKVLEAEETWRQAVKTKSEALRNDKPE